MQKGQCGTKMSGTKIGWSSRTKMSRTKMSGTKMSGTKKRNKNEWNKNRVVQWNKNQRNKNWLGPLDFEWWDPHFKCKKVRAEQKLGTGHRMSEGPHQFLFC